MRSIPIARGIRAFHVGGHAARHLHRVQIDAPYTGISKSDIARIGKRLGLDYSTTYSCYKGGEKHCGKCGTCVERKEALRDAGIEDTTEYETE